MLNMEPVSFIENMWIFIYKTDPGKNFWLILFLFDLKCHQNEEHWSQFLLSKW